MGCSTSSSIDLTLLRTTPALPGVRKVAARGSQTRDMSRGNRHQLESITGPHPPVIFGLELEVATRTERRRMRLAYRRRVALLRSVCEPSPM